jgi:F0F1-type ATP synthase membrane subunit b/b'
MAADENTGKGNKGAETTPLTGGTGAGAAKGGQQISGQQIFSTTEQSSGGESFATTGTGGTGSSAGATGGATGTGGENQANLADAVKDAVSGDTGKAKELLNQAKSATGEVASKTIGQVQEKASTFVDTKTSDAARGLTTIANSMRQFTENLRTNQEAPIAQTAAQYGETLVSQVEDLAGYLDRADLNKLTRDVESLARRNPAVFIGGAFALGILAARFIKSSSARANSTTALQTRGTTRQMTTAHGEPPPLGRTLPSLDNTAGDTGNSVT